MSDKERKIAVVLMVLGIVFTIIGSTLAYFSWASAENERTNVVFTVTAGFTCSGDGGGSITSQEKILAPTSCTNETYAFQREVTTNVTNNRSGSVYMDLWLDVNSIGQGLSESENFRYALTEQANDCEHNILSEGTFNGVEDGGRVTLLEGTEYASSDSDTYYLYVWLDAEEKSSATQNQPFNISLGGQCTDHFVSKPNKPVLDTGMIPVTISDSGIATTILSTDNNWYDYENKQWANAVLVSQGSRNNYLNTTGVTVQDTDILAYFVWIPRYSYKVWQYEGVASTVPNPPPSIDIKFVKEGVKEAATGVDQYYTHPAFTFGNKELDGIWVGKFETSNNATTPKILPKVTPLKNQTVSAQFATALTFAGGSMTNNVVSFSGSTVYGLTTATDSHMMKNSEWGAVAYLSHSKYGINTEVRINNYRGNTTGCGALEENGSATSSCGIQYGNASSYPQSTTGNISGIFDMSGGAWECVMGHWSNNLSSPSNEYSGFESMPDSKYYDLYDPNIFDGDNSTNIQKCTLATCGGHALNETASWYKDYSASFVNSDKPWFWRGGIVTYRANAGVFAFFSKSGTNDSSASFRSVLVAR